MKPILYTSENCVFCGPVKEKLKESGIDFREVSVDTEKGKKRAKEKGIRVVPAVEAGGEILVGDQINKLLKT